jgi:hypothetical protein
VSERGFIHWHNLLLTRGLSPEDASEVATLICDAITDERAAGAGAELGELQSALVGMVLAFSGFTAAHGKDWEEIVHLPSVHTAMAALGWPSYDELKHWPRPRAALEPSA